MKTKSKTKKEAAEYNNAVRAALNAYVNMEGGGGNNGLLDRLSRRVNVSKRPWFLIDGPRGAGKSYFIVNSGAPFELIRHNLFFTADAVYIDPPSGLASDDGWGVFCRRAARHKFLRRRAFDGLLAVVDIQELLSMDAAAVDRAAADLRSRADAMASATGCEVPVYFIFNKLDLFDGFTEFFSDRGTAGKLPFLGALSGGRGAEGAWAPAAEFAARFREICGELSDVCVRRVISADNPGRYDKNGRLYRFLTGFALAEAPVAAFLAEFFKPRGVESAFFGGFFFTSSRGDAPAALSRKVVGEVIPKAPRVVKELAAGTWPYYLRRAGFYALTVLLWAAFVSLFVGGGLRDATHIRALQARLSALFESGASPANQFAALEKLRASREYLGGGFRYPWRLVFGTGEAYAAVRRAYTAASERAAAQPAARCIEASVNSRLAGRAGEFPTAERLALYRELEAYLVLTGGNPVKGVNVDSMAFRVGAAFRKPPGVEDGVVMANIYTVVKLAAEGAYKNVPADINMIETARGRLAAAPQAAAVYAAAMDKLSQTRRPLPMQQITGGGGLLKYGRDVSDLYTRGGWENAVFPELIKASKEPLKADWVTGPPAAASSEEKLLSELVSLYTDDLTRRWLDFIRNTYVNARSSLPSLARDLESLAAPGCETERLLAAVCSLATQPPSDLSLSVSAKSASSIKGQVSDAVNKLRGGAASAVYDIRDPFAEARAASFAYVEAFLKNGALDAYRGGLGKLAEKIRVCADRGGYAQFLARGADDPLRECRAALDRAYASMPAQASAPLKRIFEQPLDIAAAALTKAVAEELEESWNAEVVNRYANKLFNRHPLDKKGNDLAWGDFEEFFKPQSGVLWKYSDKNLSGILERTSRGWEGVARSVSLPLSLNDEIPRCLNGAERIADNFFKKDGAPKRHEITFYPFKSSSGAAVLLIGDKLFDFKNGLPVTIGRQQGSEVDEAVILRLTTSDQAQEEMRFTGEWAALRLFEAGKVDKLGNDRYRINWKLNVRGIYTANITATVQCNTEALFDKSAIDGFVVPKRVFRN